MYNEFIIFKGTRMRGENGHFKGQDRDHRRRSRGQGGLLLKYPKRDPFNIEKFLNVCKKLRKVPLLLGQVPY